MALIGKIRKQKWLLVGSLAGALVLFIAMLMFDNPNQSLFGGSRTELGEIEGQKVEYTDFMRIHSILYQNTATDGFSDRAALWNFFVDEAVVRKEAASIGLGVSKAELLELQFSEDMSRLSPLITSRYQDPNTRMLDRAQLNQLKDIITNSKIDQLIQAGQLVPDFKYRWAHQEKEIVKDRLQTKISRMIEKGMYTPTWMAEAIAAEQMRAVDFTYVQIPFDEIDNSAITLSDDDFADYFDAHKGQFEQEEETRRIAYVTFNVTPTAADSAAIRNGIAALTADFAAAEDDSLFVENNLGIIDAAYFKKDALNPAIADTLFDMPVGSVYGPYQDFSTYKAVKILDRKVIPDSVKARHILRRVTDNPSFLAATRTIDSLRNLLETGVASFDSLAARFSEDLSNAAQGGDLGFFSQGTMVKEFNDVCFFQAEPGKVYSVLTQFGIHLIEVTDRKFIGNEPSVKVAYLTQDIVPSQATQDAVKEQAISLAEASTDLDALRQQASAVGLSVETSAPLRINDYTIGNLGIGQSSRDMVRWAFGVDFNVQEEAEVGSISPEVYRFQDPGTFHVSRFVVAALQSVQQAGTPSWQDVRDNIELMVINEKKTALVKERMAGQSDLYSIAGSFSATVDTAVAVTFSSAFLQKAGAVEPTVVSTALRTDLNQVSEPVLGSSGIFVVKPYNKPQAGSAGNVAMVKQSNQQSTRATARARVMQSLRKQADITDNRSNFF
ncbi:MAG: hypothetical protein RLY31_609 [Bacteroidota bacterium]|jgi:peptidyl-prolyl cis-trans isomerase D